MATFQQHFCKYSRWIILYCLLAGCSRGSAPRPRPPAPPAQIEIRGGPRFQQQTRQALSLLEHKTAQPWQQVRQYIHIIEQGQHSAMWAYERPPRVEINDVTAFHSLTWYAGVLAHESMHAAVYFGSAPTTLWNGQQAERIALTYQMSVMRKIQAPPHEIQYVQSLDGTHCDLDGDGDCDWADYAKRPW